MKNIKLYKVFFVLLLLFISFLFINEVQAAHKINSINMDVYIDENGDANITEVWAFETSKDTEIYHPYFNLGNSEITNLSVKDGNLTYTTLSSWNPNASFDAKREKCGLNETVDGVEICWGISSYGKHKYEVSYTITNFVSELTDSQMAYWTLIPDKLSNSPGNVYIKIHSSSDFSSTLDVWGFGKKGAPCYVYNGYIEFTSDGTLRNNEYMTILVKFPSGTFSTTNKLNHDFQYYLDMAEKGADKFISFNSVFLISIPIFLIILFIGISSAISSSTSTLDFGKAGRRMPKDVGYFRDLPCNGDIFRAYFISYNYGLMKNKTDFLGALLLKWLKEGKISIEKRTTGIIKQKEESCVILNSEFSSPNADETEIHSMMYTASKDGVLEPNEFKKWCSKNYAKVLKWFDNILESERTKLIGEGKIEEREVRKSI